jgi:hypothetical protein
MVTDPVLHQIRTTPSGSVVRLKRREFTLAEQIANPFELSLVECNFRINHPAGYNSNAIIENNNPVTNTGNSTSTLVVHKNTRGG